MTYNHDGCSFDLDLPIQCDDEYWLNEDEPENAFKQPVGVPSQVSYFVWNIKLSNFLAMTIRKIVRVFTAFQNFFMTLCTVCDREV